MDESSDNEQRDAATPETDVPGVDTDTGDKKKSIEVDTNERLDKKDKHLDDIPEDELEKQRQERLDPENRPDNTEVDNSDRTFDPETGLFEDSDLEPPKDAPYSTTDAEQSQTEKESGDSDESEESEDRAESDESEDRAESDGSEDRAESEQSKETESAQG